MKDLSKTFVITSFWEVYRIPFSSLLHRPGKVQNIWEGLKKQLPDQAPRELPDRGILNSATEKASTTTSNIKEKDYAFLITRYSGWRNGAANGLRHCDID